ncbi:hypothetical protein ACGFNU_40810 [Spirillospora sp. NPDC048911]|uniref:hypothetical protein n=1 Tax=Spirillospora sp. NPDC048911 TaxID=3364527 RepID=UPI003723D6B4
MSEPRWEHAYAVYNPYDAGSPDDWVSVEALLAAYSADGWEAVSHGHYGDWITFTFKRPIY